MCPACLAAAAAFALKAASAGGVAAYAVTKLRAKAKTHPKPIEPRTPGDRV
ncbi:MAG TPA: hypothetical protein VMF89_32850 [Polyangiales bacterium]|nr:hypothetical protein [Polyangiales bacterium]